ncbi:MAG: acyltransferase family protein, partial [Candidatus Promineifilaceae bacterium]
MGALSKVARHDWPHVRLYYLDWLRVIAVFGVFLFHAVHPFDALPWHIKNSEQSTAVTLFIAFMFPWGMPFFFLLAGAGSWFALRRRSGGEFVRERFNRLLLPFFVGSILLMPVMLYFEWLHKVSYGQLTGTYAHFLLDRNVGFTPIWFGALGYHLWFLGFLFCFSILGLPLFMWLQKESGRRLISHLAQTASHRGGLLVWIIPLAAIRLSLHPFFPEEHNWADFFFLFSFFVLGYVLYADQRFLVAVRRDWRLHLGLGIAALVCALLLGAYTGELNVMAPPRSIFDILFWILVAVDSWCMPLFVLFIGMRYLEFTNAYLAYGKDAIMPFFVFHQPVIIFLAYFAVQWQASLAVKLLFVVMGSFCLTLGIYHFL